MDVILIAGGNDQVVELIGLEVLCARDAASADAQASLSVVGTAGDEIGVNVCREHRLLPLVSEVEGRRYEMIDGTVENHLLKMPLPALGRSVGDLSCQIQNGVGIVDATGTRETVLGVFTIDLDILIGVAIVVYTTDGTVSLHVGLLAVAELSVEQKSCGELPKVVVVEELPEADIFCL